MADSERVLDVTTMADPPGEGSVAVVTGCSSTPTATSRCPDGSRTTERRNVKFTLHLDPVDAATGAPRVLPLSHHEPALSGGPLQPHLAFNGGIEARTGMRG
jgi:hypothetical protein